MNEMYVSVVAKRRKTNTVRRSVHKLTICKYGGPQRTIEHFSSCIAENFSCDWDFNVMRIASHEYHAFQRQLQADEALI